MKNEKFIYEGKSIYLLTKHKKGIWIEPHFAHLNAKILTIDTFDTDSLGSFTGEYQREGSQKETAQRKATLACELSNSELGMGSEGAFFSDPITGLLTYNREVLCLIDLNLGITVYGYSIQLSKGVSRDFTAIQDLKNNLSRFDFPNHHVILKSKEDPIKFIKKGISTLKEIDVAWNLAASAGIHELTVENDYRANHHPERQQAIGKAAQDLVKSLRNKCPSCSRPGFSVTEIIYGKTCSDCGSKTDKPHFKQLVCSSCFHEERIMIGEFNLSDSSFCQICNP